MRRLRSLRAGSGVAIFASAALLASGCARAMTPPVEVYAEPGFGGQRLQTLVVIPAEAAPGARESVAAALPAVTEMTLREASRIDHWRVVEPGDDTSADGADETTPLATRAGEVAARMGADATLTVQVARWHDRVGSDYGVAEPASVALRMILVARGETRAVWKADYAFTQEPLAYNLWNLWGVIRGGPRWLTAHELARIGVAEAVSRLAAAAR